MRMVIAVLLLATMVVGASAQKSWRQECKGILKVDNQKASTEGSRFFIEVPPEGVCEINGSENGKVIAVCTPGHFCRIFGWTENCKDSGECSELTNILSVRTR
jgi:hypothetical protein